MHYKILAIYHYNFDHNKLNKTIKVSLIKYAPKIYIYVLDDGFPHTLSSLFSSVGVQNKLEFNVSMLYRNQENYYCDLFFKLISRKLAETLKCFDEINLKS